MSEQRISSEEITALQVRAVADHLKRCSIPAQAQPHRRNARRVILQPAPRNDWPLISIVVSSTNCLDHIEQCLESIYSRSSYKNFEVILVGEGLRDSTAISCLSKYGIKLAIWDHHANVSRAFNLGVLQAGGDYLVFLNGNIEIVTPEWLETMLLYLEGPRIGAVGPLLIHPDNTVREAGIAFDGPPHYVRRIMTGFLSDCDGYEGCLSCAREVSAIGSDCMMLRRDTFIEAGGFEEYYEHDYQDIDLCLRVRNLSKSILLVPGAVLIHHGTSDRDVFGDVLDRALFLDLWNDIAEKGDTFHNAVQAAFEYRLRKECF